jgi:GDP/UDP-N,N'-diacetylbacillosamine 2-epimerase (hydrolysing)
MRIGILTSSRADFGIYLPLLKILQVDIDFQIKIIAFGTHLSKFHGYTKNEIISNGFHVSYEIESILISDTPNGISSSLALTTLKFSDFWSNYGKEFDLIFCIGDRYEMFAAVISGIPYQIKFAHIHGGETTLGSIDNTFRHSITLASDIHFVSTEKYSERVFELLNKKENVFVTGALSLDNLKDMILYDTIEFQNLYGVDLLKKTVLLTFHPETINFEKNETYIKELIKVISNNSNFQFIITMPNSDTNSIVIRDELILKFGDSENVWLVENLGTRGYFTVLKYCCFLMGNSSSGIIEAASFGKFVINLGDRQRGREAGANVLHVKIQQNEIQNAMRQIEKFTEVSFENIYYNGGAAQKIVNILKQIK